MTDVLVEIISALGLIVVTVLQIRSERERKRRKAADAVRDQQQNERQRDDLEMSLAKGRVLLASGDLAYVTSIAVHGGHTNGNVEAAQKAFREAQEAYDALETKLARKYLKTEGWL